MQHFEIKARSPKHGNSVFIEHSPGKMLIKDSLFDTTSPTSPSSMRRVDRREEREFDSIRYKMNDSEHEI